jgi:hypothetical protein
MMGVFSYSARCEMMFEGFLRETGKERKTTFYSDLSIAEYVEGANGVKDTYKRVIAHWKDDVEYMSEFVVALNQKIWQHYSKNYALAKEYNSLWIQCDDFCRQHFKGEELSYYYRYID